MGERPPRSDLEPTPPTRDEVRVDGDFAHGATTPAEAVVPAPTAATPSTPSVAPRPTRERDLVGRILDGRYTLVAQIGEGGMGTVYRARQHSMDRDVAVKVMHPAMLRNQTAVDRFLREAKILSRLSHPNTITVFDFGKTDSGVLYLVMELLVGRPLSDVIEQDGAMEPSRVVRILGQVCDSLAEAHARDLVHRDLKPDNIFLIEGQGVQDSVKVLDFGIARLALDGGTRLTREGATVGTPHYMSPEQVQARPLDARSDIYSLGVIAFEMFTGELPFDAGHATAIMMMHLSHPSPRPSERRTELAPGVDDLVARSLAKTPDGRPATVTDFRQLLADSVRPQTVESLPPDPRVLDTQAPPDDAASAPDPAAPEEPLPAAEGAVEPDAQPTHEGRPRSRAPWVLAAIAVIAAAAAAAAVLGPPSPDPASTEGATSPVEGEDEHGDPDSLAASSGAPAEPEAIPEAGATEGTPPEGSASGLTLVVSSQPPGAKILIDGEQRGVTPTQLSGVAPDATLLLVAKGHVSAEVAASAATNGALHVDLAAPAAPAPKPAPPVRDEATTKPARAPPAPKPKDPPLVDRYGIK